MECRIRRFCVMSTDSESYEAGSSYYGRGSNGGGCDANDRRIAQIEKAFGSSGQVRKDRFFNGFASVNGSFK